jgi:glycosyltransferase involved in cell wall biosynthesis
LGSLKLSVIICTYNRARLLKTCLQGLRESLVRSPEPVEILVVDNNSDDQTPEMVSRMARSLSKLRYVHEPRQGLSYARNRGCDEAQGAYLAYCDDDSLAPPDYLHAVIGVIHAYAPDIFGGPVYPFYEEKRPSWFLDEYEVRKHADQSGFSQSCRLSGSNFIIRKDLLLRLGKFDPVYGMKGKAVTLGEERALLERYRNFTPQAEQRVFYALEAYVRHLVPAYKMKRLYMLKRYFQSGIAMARIQPKNSRKVLQSVRRRSGAQMAQIFLGLCRMPLGDAEFMMALLDLSIRAGHLSEAVRMGFRNINRVRPSAPLSRA